MVKIKMEDTMPVTTLSDATAPSVSVACSTLLEDLLGHDGNNTKDGMVKVKMEDTVPEEPASITKSPTAPPSVFVACTSLLASLHPEVTSRCAARRDELLKACGAGR